MTRDLDCRFLDAMREKLEHGRKSGYDGWDLKWIDCSFPIEPTGVNGYFMTRLVQELLELTAAIYSQDKALILSEAADVANFAMMVADIHGTLRAAEEVLR